jgi:chromosome segregation ATPase
MSMTLPEAITALQVHARQQEAVQVVAGAVRDIQSLDQMRSEIERRRAEAEAKLAEVQSAIKAGQDTLEKLAGAAAEAHAEGDKIIAAARKQGDDIKSEARAHAEQIAASAARQHEIEQEKRRAQIEILDNQIRDANARHEELKARHADLKANVEDIEARAQAARDYLANLARGG